MTLYWMLDSHWPSFFGNIFDYYLCPGGAYYGAKKGLRPVSAVFDAYATGDHSHAKITIVNQLPVEQDGLRLRLRVYDLQGNPCVDREVNNIDVASGDTFPALTLPRFPNLTPVYFVRCQLFDRSGHMLVDNVYWQSQKDDDYGDPDPADAFSTDLVSWADMTALNTMPPVSLELSAQTAPGDRTHVTIRLHNPTAHIAFFERAEITPTRDGDEILPIQYDDNYITVFPGETTEIHSSIQQSCPTGAWVKVQGYNTPETSTPLLEL
jgi:exo-1,4-beta-D-glucosaminidase